MNADDLHKLTGGNEEDEARRPNPFPYSESEDIPLPEGYMPTIHDVVNGRGRKSYNHIANRRFRQLIAMNLERYLAARCKVDKTLVVVGIVNTIRNSTPAGGFLKKCPKRSRWISLSDESAREKVGHCLRDMLAAQREEKNKAASKGLALNKSGNVEPPTTGPLAILTDKQLPPINNPWLQGRQAVEALAQSRASRVMDDPFASMWSAVKNDMNDRATQSASAFPPLTAVTSRAPDPPPTILPLNLNNLDAIALQKGHLQDMSDQQRKILFKLEGGFKGTVEELMEAIK